MCVRVCVRVCARVRVCVSWCAFVFQGEGDRRFWYTVRNTPNPRMLEPNSRVNSYVLSWSRHPSVW